MSRLFFLISMTCTLCMSSAHAEQILNDPMRPPSFSMSVENGKTGPVLQTIVIGDTQRYAIIDGQRLVPGALHEGARLVRIAENEVILRNADGDLVLKLYPDIKSAAPRTGNRDIAQGERENQ